MSRFVPGIGTEADCAGMASSALESTQTMIEAAEKHQIAGRLRHAVAALKKASVQLGRADALVEFCQLEPPFALTQMFARAAMLEGKLGDDCEHGWKAGLSGGVEDPYEAYRKLRKPLPKQRSKPIGSKKGKKGYDRKRNEQRSRRED